MARGGSPIRNAIDALQRLSNTELKPENYEAFFKEIGGVGSDRGAGILMVTSVEDTLQAAIESRLSIPSDQRDIFFGADSPLGTFANKIRIGLALDIFDVKAKQNLTLLKAIRNAFAHSKISIDFETSEIKMACDLLAMPAMPMMADGTQMRWAPQQQRYKGRARFQVVCTGQAQAFSTYAFLANNRHLPSDQLDNRYETLVRPKPLG
jgi:hypothetical protein